MEAEIKLKLEQTFSSAKNLQLKKRKVIIITNMKFGKK